MSKIIYLAVEIDDDDIDLTDAGQMRILEQLTFYMDASTLAPIITGVTLSVEPPSPNDALLTAAKNALDWFNAYEFGALDKPDCEEITTQLDSAIAAADPDFVC